MDLSHAWKAFRAAASKSKEDVDELWAGADIIKLFGLDEKVCRLADQADSSEVHELAVKVRRATSGLPQSAETARERIALKEIFWHIWERYQDAVIVFYLDDETSTNDLQAKLVETAVLAYVGTKEKHRAAMVIQMRMRARTERNVGLAGGRTQRKLPVKGVNRDSQEENKRLQKTLRLAVEWKNPEAVKLILDGTENKCPLGEVLQLMLTSRAIDCISPLLDARLARVTVKQHGHEREDALNFIALYDSM
eukprot:1812121-Prymnesium_polylepis.1